MKKFKGSYTCQTLLKQVIGTCTRITQRSEFTDVNWPPYKLPKYFPVRIFSLEYIRQMINSDDIHFVAFKKKQQLRIRGRLDLSFATTELQGKKPTSY
jgi:hypothetical protein